MRIDMVNSRKISIFVLSCLVGYILITSVRWRWKHESVDSEVPVPAALRRRYLRYDGSYRPRPSTNLSLGALYARLEAETAATVRNWAHYGPVHADTTALVVLAHRDLDRLQHLVVSLAQVRDIESVLVVFSHSYYDERIDELVKSIDFCLVKQIYYPNSVQLYPASFPGTDVGDCKPGAPAGANPPPYCARRDGRRAERKHHWWWTAHTVFGESWPWFVGHSGMVMFVREDSYVLSDLVYMMSFARRALSHLPEVEVIALGRLGPQANDMDYDKFTIAIWKPLYENGLAFNRSTWAKILYRSVEFCEYDDTSWSSSLLAVFGRWAGGRALAVASAAPRVLPRPPTGARARLFPREVRALALYDRAGMRLEHFKLPPRGNGGWTDARDHSLCLEPLMATNTEDDSTTTTPNFDTIKSNSRL